jgi:hypothetical protein
MNSPSKVTVNSDPFSESLEKQSRLQGERISKKDFSPEAIGICPCGVSIQNKKFVQGK